MSRNDTQIPDLDQHLDRILADMADGVPPVPDDFRQRWRQAVRSEAEAAASDPAAGKAARKSAASKPGKTAASLKQPARFLQIAAVFLFVLGGVMSAGPSLFLRQEPVLSSSFKDASSTVYLPEATGMPLTLSAQETASGMSDAAIFGNDAMEETEMENRAEPDLIGTEAPAAGTYMLDATGDSGSRKTVSADHLKNTLSPAEATSYAMDAGIVEEEDAAAEAEAAAEADGATEADTAEMTDYTTDANTAEEKTAGSTVSEEMEEAADTAASKDREEAVDSPASTLFWQIGGLALMLLSVLLLILSRRRPGHSPS